MTQNPMRLGNVTSERWMAEFPLQQVWTITKSPYYPDQGDYQLRYIRTHGEYGMNNVDFELPPGSSFPVYHFWRVIDVEGTNLVQLRSVLQFDWDGVGEQCLKHNGNGTDATFEECDTQDWTQHWIYIDPVSLGSVVEQTD
ncbi:uncharacterized protein LOC110862255 isoform X2 [Folsomia candida]|nr:uncharacterized protein LOC110862255 isoform X2 [Folsomia candida]